MVTSVLITSCADVWSHLSALITVDRSTQPGTSMEPFPREFDPPSQTLSWATASTPALPSYRVMHGVCESSVRSTTFKRAEGAAKSVKRDLMCAFRPLSHGTPSLRSGMPREHRQCCSAFRAAGPGATNHSNEESGLPQLPRALWSRPCGQAPTKLRLRRVSHSDSLS